MGYSELVLYVQMKEDVKASGISLLIASFIQNRMLQDDSLSELHKETGIKQYTYSHPQPIEQDKMYHNNRIYYINIRSINVKILMRFKKVLYGECDTFKVLSSEMKNYNVGFINKLITLTPIVITLEGRYYVKEDGLELLIQKIASNANRKYEIVTGKKVDKDHVFIESIKLLNKRAILIPYNKKKTTLLGHKVEIQVKGDELSQDIAKIALAIGISEKNSLSCGYAMYK